MAVVCLNGLTPAAITFKPLQEVLSNTPLVLHDLAVYADRLDENYGLETEFGALEQAIEATGDDRAHLIGNSAGASVAIAYALRNPRRVRTIAAVEPPFIGNDSSWSNEYRAFLTQLDQALIELQGVERQQAFVRALTPPGHALPVLGEPPTWLAERSHRQEYLWQSFRRTAGPYDHLDRLSCPTYVAVGGQTHPAFKEIAERLAAMCQARVEIYPEVNHFAGAHQAQPIRFARALGTLWG
jgi:pimeloyl-ACP methyl ester carboxylesterase